MIALKSLRAQLLTLLLGPLLCVIGFNTWTGYLNAQATAGVITDRLLLASARSMAEQIKATDGIIEVLIPPSALEMFATDEKDHVAYNITGPDGTLLAGYADLVLPVSGPRDLQPVYVNISFRQQPMRVVALRQPLITETPNEAALVIVGETLHAYDRIASDIWRRNSIQQVLLVAIAGGLTWFGLNRGLLPLTRLRNALIERDPSHLEPFSTFGLQTELQPLVTALNHALARIEKQIAVQRRFIADAAHQLRTPLTLLKTQASVGLREEEMHAAQEALAAIVSTTDAMTRLTNQLLTLAKAEPDHAHAANTSVDLVALVQHVLARHCSLAKNRKIDLSLDLQTADGHIGGDPTLLHELIVNLLDNALKYTPEYGKVRVYLQRSQNEVVFGVEDSGIGIPVAEQARVFERFYRVLGTGVDGSGLGLSIVTEVTQIHRGRISLCNRQDHSGLSVEVSFPAMPAQDRWGNGPIVALLF
jgi:two-component system sensor histidine kinase TctE